MTLKINKELLRGLVGEWETHEDYEIVQNEIRGTGRWSIYYDCTIKHIPTKKFYNASYSQGATERQCEEPFDDFHEDEDGNIVLTEEVEPYDVTITKYRKKDIE